MTSRSNRLYLVHAASYRVRSFDGRERVCRWDDHTQTFVTGRGTERRTFALSSVAACAAQVKHLPRARWFPLDACFRAKHQPAPSTSAWVHPYARSAA